MNQNILEVSVEGKLTWEETTRDDLFYEPKMESHIIRGQDTGYRTIYREQEGGEIVPIASVSQWYSLIPNTTLHETIIEAPVPLSLNSRLSSSYNGRFHLVYDVDMEADLGADETDGGHDGLKPQLKLDNSYNGSRALMLEFGVFRKVCSNGLVINEAETGRILKRHIVLDQEELKKQINEYLIECINKEYFDRIRGKITSAKIKKNTLVPFGWLSKLPYYQLFTVLKAITEYCEFYVYTQEKQKRFDLRNGDSANELVISIIEKRTDKPIEREYQLSQYEATMVSYDKAVSNQWLLYNMLIQIVQHLVGQHKRLQVASDLSRMFL